MAAKPKAIVTFIASRVEYLKCKESMPGGCSEKLFTECVKGIIEQLSLCKPISCEDAIGLQMDIKNSPLPAAAMQQLSDAIDAKVSMEANAEDGDVKKQVHLHLENYGTDTFWSKFDSGTVRQKLAYIAELMASIGVGNATEPTWAKCASLAVAKEGGASTSCSLENTRTLKACMAALKSANKVAFGGLPKYPEDPLELRTLAPLLFMNAYTNEPPTRCPVNPTLMALVKTTATCRSSKGNGPSQVLRRSATQLALRDTDMDDIDLTGFKV